MLTDKIKELEAAKAKVEELEKKIIAERQSELAALPAKFGFDSVEAFAKALKAAARGGGKKQSGRKAAAAKPAKKTRTRAKITDEVRAEVKKLVEAGTPGAAIAKTLGISLPSVQNIKKALGLVKARS